MIRSDVKSEDTNEGDMDTSSSEGPLRPGPRASPVLRHPARWLRWKRLRTEESPAAEQGAQCSDATANVAAVADDVTDAPTLGRAERGEVAFWVA